MILQDQAFDPPKLCVAAAACVAPLLRRRLGSHSQAAVLTANRAEGLNFRASDLPDCSDFGQIELPQKTQQQLKV